MFRSCGLQPAGEVMYEVIMILWEREMAAEPNIGGSGLPEFAVGLGLLGRGEADSKWTLSMPKSSDIDQGIFQATGKATAKTARIFFVNSVTAALKLINHGALTNRTDIVFHSDNAWLEMIHSVLICRLSPMDSFHSV